MNDEQALRLIYERYATVSHLQQTNEDEIVSALAKEGWHYDGIQKGLEGEPFAYTFTKRDGHGSTILVKVEMSVDEAIQHARKADENMATQGQSGF